MAYLQLPLVGTPGPAGPAGGGLAAVEDDLTPRLGGNLDGNSKLITSIGTINAVDIAAHAARHKGGGADVIDDADGSNSGLMPSADFTKLAGIATGATNTPLTAATPAISLGSVGTVGVSPDAARADHRHQVSTATVVTIGTANSAGSAGTMARSDHVHGHGAQTVDSLHALAVANVSHGFLSASDKDKLDTMAGTSLSNATPEISLASTGAAGASADASRGDHRHQMSTAAPVDIGSANDAGVATSVARSDHVHDHANQAGGALHAVAVAGVSHGFISSADQTKLNGIATGATALDLSDTAGANVSVAAAIAGVGTDASRFDHTHQVQAGTPVAVGAANAAGSATTLARSDHVHDHGSQTSQSMHALAVASTSHGFMSSSDKTKLDGLSAGGFAPSAGFQLLDDFISSNADTDEFAQYGWRVSKTGTGNAFAMIDGESGHPGIVRISGGSAAGARSCGHLGQSTVAQNMVLGSGELTFETVVRFNGTTSNQEVVMAGLGDVQTTVGENTNGVYIEFLAADTNWFLVCNNSSTKTRVDLGIAANSTWRRLGFIVNTGGTSVQGYVDGVLTGAAITTNIPSAAISPMFKADGNGTSADTTDFDYFYLFQTLTR